jgi:hypothetical protein
LGNSGRAEAQELSGSGAEGQPDGQTTTTTGPDAQATADANKTQAEADKTQAEGNKTQAEADQIISQTETAETTAEIEADQARSNIETTDDWWDAWLNPEKLGPFVTVTAATLGTIAGGFKWLITRRDEQAAARREREQARQDAIDKERKDEDDKFGAVLVSLDSPDEAAKLKASTDLFGYTHEYYERCHQRIFDAAVGVLRNREIDLAQPPKEPTQFEENIIRAFLKVIPSLQETERQKKSETHKKGINVAGYPDPDKAAYAQYDDFASPLDASRINLEGAFLVGEDLSMLDLDGASFRGARLNRARFINTDLRDTHFEDAQLRGARFMRVDGSDMRLDNADLKSALFFEIDFATMNIEAAGSLDNVQIGGIKNLDPSRLEAVKARGAKIINDDVDYPSPGDTTSTGDTEARDEEE